MCTTYIRDLREITQHDGALVGGKSASLGEMVQFLSSQGIRIPLGFAITADAYRYFISYNNLNEYIQKLHDSIVDYTNYEQVTAVGGRIRLLIQNGTWPEDLSEEIVTSYRGLSEEYQEEQASVAVRSSATAEDLPTASFAGQQETFLHVRGSKRLLDAVKNCFASLFTDRALVYRHEQGFDKDEIALAVCVQYMVASDYASSGVMFTLDTESGFRDVVTISAAYGLGEGIVQGLVNPDEYIVYKKKLLGRYPVIQKKLGNKHIQVVYDDKKSLTYAIEVSKIEQQKFALSSREIAELAEWGILIEDHYKRPMDIEWAKSSIDGKLYIVQARPETIHGIEQQASMIHYRLTDTKSKIVLAKGQSIGKKIVSGPARLIKNRSDMHNFQKGDVLITSMTDPDWVPLLKLARGMVTDLGGRTCHAAIVSRELGIPAVVGTQRATQVIHDGQMITLDGSQGSEGFVYEGVLRCATETIFLDTIDHRPCELMVNIAHPQAAFTHAFLPVSGVGLVRIEFIINSFIGVHPMAAAELSTVPEEKIVQEIQERAAAYESVSEFFVETLAQGISTVAAAFYPRPVIVRLSDFKSNEYRNLLGGKFFEPQEENPMLGWRGAARYTTPSYASAFALECAALRKVREMGFSNIKIMVPFVRTVAEAEATCTALARQGLERGKNGLELFMMVELPTNVITLDLFAPLFDGFSIGSNDLTQLTLGVDRDSGLLSNLFDERDEAVRRMLALAIKNAHEAGKYISICGQAPSDYPEIAQFLLDQGIDAISLNSDAIVPFLMRYAMPAISP